ncbi:MAG: DNA-protecting protein DprA, partial [Betaproteobacteria bacterium]
MASDAERAGWVRLTLTPGIGARTARELLARFGLPEA